MIHPEKTSNRRQELLIVWLWLCSSLKQLPELSSRPCREPSLKRPCSCHVCAPKAQSANPKLSSWRTTRTSRNTRQILRKDMLANKSFAQGQPWLERKRSNYRLKQVQPKNRNEELKRRVRY